MHSTRPAVAAYILMRAAASGHLKLTGDVLAESLDTNAVVVRRIIAQLSRAGLARSVRGRGGLVLCRPPKDISLSDVLQAVVTSDSGWLLPIHPIKARTNHRDVLKALHSPFQAAENAVLRELSRVSIADLLAAELNQPLERCSHS